MEKTKIPQLEIVNISSYELDFEFEEKVDQDGENWTKKIVIIVKDKEK